MIRVLIVEDDPMVAEMNRFYLERVEGFEFGGWAESPEEALKKLEEESFGLILLDLYMKEENGLELLAEIRRRSLPIDAIVISAASDKGSIQRALQNGVVDYLIKPFEFGRFKGALGAYRERHLLLRERSNLGQAELDALTRRTAEPARGEPLPKGFTKQTLRAVWNAIESLPGDSFSSEEIAAATGVSRVSAGKYLAGLTEMNVLEMDQMYGTIGRPVQRYRVLPGGRTIIAAYV
ncbi:response regulator [Saccharibacillus sp. CPCC 101409]|uniref:response regulator n=1 Tax=Saccharibacillus sp. CPCC 101409 TaxID=3058041 RepID=UPI002672C003|nr:response regulator [Saccharibacillus sp. CPCC 101409]MDO3410024.1 response regulator [Saccharibacillus sp. CPCC 101409]